MLAYWSIKTNDLLDIGIMPALMLLHYSIIEGEKHGRYRVVEGRAGHHMPVQ